MSRAGSPLSSPFLLLSLFPSLPHVLFFTLYCTYLGDDLNAHASEVVHRTSPREAGTDRPRYGTLNNRRDIQRGPVITYNVARLARITHFAGEPVLPWITLEMAITMLLGSRDWLRSYGGFNEIVYGTSLRGAIHVLGAVLMN